MVGYIGLAGLILITLFIIFLFIRRKKIENELGVFYKNSQLFGVKEIPESIRETIGGGKWFYFKGSLIVEHKPFEFYWLENLTSSIMVVNNTSQTTVNYILAVVFPPNTVSQDFMNKAFEWKNSASAFKDFFILNVNNPYRVEKLSDGSFLIQWNVLNRADVYQKKLDWLQANLS